MKRLISIILLAVVLCATLAVCVSSAVPYAVTRTCSHCYQRTLTVRCENEQVGMYGDVDCSMTAQHGNGCRITQRTMYESTSICSNQACNYCGIRESYDVHVQTCYHTGNQTSYTVCNYGT